MRYIRRGTSKVFWLADPALTAITDTTAPTTAELAAAVDITAEIENLVNFEILTGNIDRAGHGTPFVTQIRGTSEAQGTPEIQFFDNPDDVTVQALFAPGLIGYLIFTPDAGGITATARCEVWPVAAHGPGNGWQVEQAAARWSSRFAIEQRPEIEAVIP